MIADTDDKKEFQVVLKAMAAIGFTKEEETLLLEGVASILHLGNVGFTAQDGVEGCTISPNSLDCNFLLAIHTNSLF